MYDGYEHRRTLGGLEEFLEEQADDVPAGKKRKNRADLNHSGLAPEHVQPNKDIKKYGARTWVFIKTNADPKNDDDLNVK